MPELEERGRIDDDVNERLTPHSLNKKQDSEAAGDFKYSPDGDNTPAGDPSDPRGPGLDNVRNQEGLGGGKSDGFFNPDDKKKGRGKFRGRFKNRKTAILGSGVIGGGAVTVLLVLFLAVPLKIEHMVSNLQNRFFGNSEKASEELIDNMTMKYYKNHVLKDYKNCGSTISRKCKVSIAGGSANPVTQLYKNYADTKFEHTLATKYNFEVTFNKKSNSWRVKAPGISDRDGLDLGRDGENLGAVFTNRQEVRKAFRNSIESETKWKNMYYRFKVGSLLEEKYGIKRCMVFCGKRDQFADKVDQKKNAAKIIITQRVVSPRLKRLGPVMECLFEPSCEPNKTSTANADSNGGEPSSELEDEIRTADAADVPHFGSTDPAEVERMTNDYNTISEKGYRGFLINKVLTKIGLEQFSDNVTSAGPVIGWVTKISSLVTTLDTAGPKVKKLSYIVNSGPAVKLFSAYRTYSDEIHTGKVDPTEIGSFSDALSPGDRGAKTDPIKGGTASAESSPLYSAVINGPSYSSGPHKSVVDNLLPSTAFADSKDKNTQSSDYQCEDNKKLDGLTCPEEKLGTGNATLNNIHDFLNSPGISSVTSIAGTINSITNGILKPINGLIGGVSSALLNLTGLSKLTDAVGKIFAPVFTDLTQKVIPDPFSTNMSGARTFNMMAAGANVAGNDACTAIGCSTVSSAQAAASLNKRQQEAKEDFQSQPLFARMFSTSSDYSLATRLAMKVPLNSYSSAQSGVASILSNPVAAITNSFGSIFHGPQAFAATSADAVDPFKIGSVDFPSDEIPSDPEGYWDFHNCGDDSENGPNAQWEKAASSDGGGSTNPDTGMPIHTSTNACKLIKASVGNAGGSRDTDLLDKDEKAVLNGGKSVGGDSSDDSSDSSGGTISGEAKDLAKQIVDAGNLTGDPRYMGQIQAVAKGDYSCNVNPDILKMLVGVTVNDKHKVVLSSLNRKCTGVLTASGTASYHYTSGGGHAIDVTSYDGQTVNGGNGASKHYLEEASKYLPKNAGYGQDTCGSGFSYPSGSSHFYDTCDHQHLQVPVKSDKQ